MFKKILVATDGSEFALNGLNSGIDLAKALSAELCIVTISSPIPGYSVSVTPDWIATAATIEEEQENMNETTREILEKAKKITEEAGITPRLFHAEHPLAAHGIADVAKKIEADLIIVTSHGRRGLKRVLLGSQAQELLSLSEIPVLVIK